MAPIDKQGLPLPPFRARAGEPAAGVTPGLGRTGAEVFYLSSFPRSGNTWLRFLIANAYNEMDRQVTQVDFFNVHAITPELKKNSESQLRPGITPLFKEFPLVVKTHADFMSSFTHVILLLRNPFDCLYSYWDYLVHNNRIPLSLSETARHQQYGVSAIVRHADSYLRHCDDLLLVTYEDLLRRPESVLGKLFDFIGLAVASRVVKKAIRKSSFHAMSRLEREKGRRFGRPDFRFMRKGETGQGERVIRRDGDLHQFILSEIKKSPVLHLLYG